MNLPVLLLLLRLVGAAVLIGFLALIVWFIYQDMRLTNANLIQQERTVGHLRVIANALPHPAVDTVYTLQSVTKIGRADRNTIVLEDHFASNEHALITWRGNQWWLEDLESRNGTLLNEAPLSETAVISNGDIIAIGDTQFKVEI